MTDEPTKPHDGGQRVAEYNQVLTPLFVVALALTGFGFYLAFGDEPEVDPEREHTGAFGEAGPLVIPPEAVDRDVEAVDLAHRAAPMREVELSLRQTTRRKDDARGKRELHTKLDLDLEEETESQPPGDGRKGESVAISRGYTRAGAEVTTGDGRAVGPGLTAQVEALLAGSKTRVELTRYGEPVDFEWIEVPNPQARRTLFLVRDAQRFLTPRFMIGAVNPGDRWSYKEPVRVEEPDLGFAASGNFDIESRFVGLLADSEPAVGVIRQHLTLGADGTAEQDGETVEFHVDGGGQATLLVELETGRVHAGDVDFERTLTVEEADQPEVQTSQISFALRSKEGDLVH